MRSGAHDEQGPVFIHAEECAGPTAGQGLPFAEAHRTVRRYRTLAQCSLQVEV
ncbi:hypothetical protein QFZ32_005953 [Streptomyces canus]|nr:hypothetical protein [Streptomyces canus]